MRRGGFRSRSLSIVLIITLLIGMGGVNSFAMEGDEIPTATEDEIVLEDGIVPEDLEKEDTGEDIEKENPEEEDLEGEDIGENPEENDLEGNLAQEVQGSVAPMSNVILLESNIIEVESADQLTTALDAIPDGGTIRLLNNIKYTQVIKIIDKAITFDLEDYTLDVETTGYAGLSVEDGGVDILGTGELNVTGLYTGVTAKNATVTVSNAISTSLDYYEYNSGALAFEDGHITVTGDVIGTTNGVYATGNRCSITVEGCVMATGSGGYGARAHGGVISIEEYVIATGTNSWGVFCNMGEITIGEYVIGKGWGVVASGIDVKPGICHIGGDITSEGKGVVITADANVTVDGKIDALTYIEIINQVKDGSIESRVIPTTKEGYHTYKYKDVDEYSDKYVVWVKATGDEPIEPIAKIGTKEYTTLDEALDEVNTGETIQLLKNIDYNKGIKINGKKITFDVGSFNLNVVNSSGPGLEVLNGGEVALESTTGQFNVTGAGYGVYVDSGRDKSPTKATVTNATVTSMVADKFYGAYAFNIGSDIVVLEDVKATGNKGVGVRAHEGGAITVNGNVEGSMTGAVAEGDLGVSVITIKGNVTSTADDSDVKTTPHGVYVLRNGNVTVNGNVLATGNGSIGAQTYGSGEIKVTGNVEGKKLGVGAKGGAIVIGGDAIGVDGRDGTGALTESGGNIIIDGNAIGGSNGVVARSGNITIKKDVKGKNHGVDATGDNSIVTVNGSAIATEKDGAYAYYKAKIFIKGDAISVNPSGGYSGYGARADSSSTIEVEGDVNGLGGAWAEGNSEITIGGNAISTANATSDVASVVAVNNSSVILSGNTSGGQYGAKSLNRGNITIDGIISQIMYINIDGNRKNIDDYNPNTTKAGYRTYTDGTNNVWVKIGEADTEPPTWPGDSTITGYPTATTLLLTWPKAIDNVGVDKYLIYTVTYSGKDGDPGTTTFIEEVSSDNEREYELKNLDPETKYRIRITAVDKSGNINEWSLEREFTTKKAFTVSFNSQGGTLIDNQIITDGEPATNPTTTRAGYTFGGWFKESECLNAWNFDNDTVTANITLYAKWIDVEIEPPTVPTITTNLPTTKSVAKGDTVILAVNANVNDGGILSYQWYKDGAAIVGANADSLTITNASSSDSGSYKVVITNTKGGIYSLVESRICTLTVNSSSGDRDNDYNPVNRDKKKDRDTKKPEEIYYGIIILDIDEDILDENTLVPYFRINRDDITIKLCALVDGKIHLIGNSKTKYGLKNNMKYFTDISNHWAKDDINFVTAREFFQGIGTDEFGPDTPITRAMVAATLGKLWNVDISLYKTSRFIDVKIDEPYAPYVEWATENGIVNGLGNNYFGPERPVTREEIAVIITKFIKYTNLALNKTNEIAPIFEDYNIISDWAKESVRTIQNLRIICGKLDNIFDPKGMTTRAEAAVILKRLIINIVK